MKNYPSTKALNKIITKLLDAYAAEGVIFDIKERVPRLRGNRLRLKVKFLPGTQLEAIKRHKEDVRRILKLQFLEVEERSNAVFIIISQKLDEEEFLLKNLVQNPEVIEKQKAMSIGVPIGVNDLGSPIVIDLGNPSLPHMTISGGTGSGKTCSVKSMILSTLAYPPDELNLLLGDRANDLAQFEDLPHLSYPLIEDFDTFLKVLLVLKDELDRRLPLKQTPEMEQLPFILMLIDEFTSFMSEAPNKERLDLAVDTLTQLLRRGRHAKIHFVLAAHNPTKENMKIDTADLPVKMAFKVSNLHNSITALSVGGAEKLKGNGDMLFKGANGIQHLHGTYIVPDDIEDYLSQVRTYYNTNRLLASEPCIFSSALPRGPYGFTITEAELHQKEDELRAKRIQPSFYQSTKVDGEVLFASVLLWTLEQEEISCNMISEGFKVGWRRANEFIAQLHDMGVVGDLDAKLPRKVLLHSVEDTPQETQELLQRYSIFK